ncbi:MAG TPA: hypothetical protein VNW99_08590, partial [Cytophagaceae bacterium]|nr:hypothetical protein [Cytophagaceae bacterium]
DAWKEINNGAFVVFFSKGHVATGIPTSDDKMTKATIEGKSYTFGRIIQAGKSVDKFALWNGFGKKLIPSGIRIYKYIGPVNK